MSSHREAPEISKDPVADNTDTYAFVSPDAPDTVTILANYIPLEAPAGGPNFYEFGDDVLYEIHISNAGTAASDLTFQFQFTTQVADPSVFLYNLGAITSLGSANWNRKQFYTVTLVTASGTTTLGSNLPCPPCNIGPLSTPNYSALAAAAIQTLSNGVKVFAGQRAEGFFVDLGAVFDLGDLRPFENLHAGSSLAAGSGINALATSNVHTIALQIPKTLLTKDGSNPTDPTSATAVIGVYASASRQKVRMYNATGVGDIVNTGPFEQVSRLGMPLFNEVLVGVGQKDQWNSSDPSGDSIFAPGVAYPALADLLPVLYPGVFPNLAALNATIKPLPAAMQRADLLAIFLTGIPSGIIAGFQNFTGTTQADFLRLNMAIAPTASPSAMGLLGNDAAGFPNGRRVTDDIVTIELQALAGVTYPLVDKSFTPDGAAAKVTDGATAAGIDFLANFPYLPDPHSGYDTPSGTGSTAGLTEPLPVGGPETGGGGAAGLAHRAPVVIGAAALAAAGATTAVVAATNGHRTPSPASSSPDTPRGDEA